MKKLIIVTAILIAGCVQMYTPPVSLSPSSIEALSQSKEDIFMAATRALVTNGYQITASDESSGIISTAPHDLRLAPEQADCGTLLGAGYLQDNRTSTRVSFGIIIDNRKIEVKSNIEGRFKGGESTDLTLTCVSKGLLEREMLQKIKAEIRY